MAGSAPSPSDAAIKTRILNHMNTDHADSLSLYLQHHYHLSSFRAQYPQVTDISFTTLTIDVSSLPEDFHVLGSARQTYEVPISPPLESWADARPRMVAMHEAALRALGRSDVCVKRYRGPDRGWMYAWLLFLLCVILAFSTRANFLPGSLLYDTLGLGRVGDFAEFCHRIQPILVGFVGVVHVAEIVWVSRGRLRRYNVDLVGAVWWYWVVSVAIEGFAAIMRFDEEVGRERKRREAKKH